MESKIERETRLDREGERRTERERDIKMIQRRRRREIKWLIM